MTHNEYLLLAVDTIRLFFDAFTVMVHKNDIKILTELLDLDDIKVISPNKAKVKRQKKEKEKWFEAPKFIYGIK